MNRYDISKSLGRMVTMDDGEWVTYETAEELYEVVRHLLTYRDSIVPDSVFEMAEEALQKARGEGE